MSRYLFLLVGILSLLNGSLVHAQDALPTQPTNVRAVLYDGAGGEVFWDRASDDKAVIGYEIKINSTVVGVFDALSYYDSTFSPDQNYQISITSIDSAQQRSLSSLVSLGSAGEPTLPPVADAPVSILDAPTGLTAQRYSVSAGELFWARASVPGLEYEIQLPDGRIATTDGISYFTSELVAGENRFSIIAIDQQGNRSQPTTLEVPAFNVPVFADNPPVIIEPPIAVTPPVIAPPVTTPPVVTAPPMQSAGPDIYLLLGQSNMVGRGNDVDANALAQGFDSTDESITQLNVTENLIYNTISLDAFLTTFTPLSPEHYVLADDPLHEPFEPTRQGKSGTEIGMGLSFAKAAVADNGRDVVLVPAAYAGTAFCANAQNVGWNVDSLDNPVYANNWLYLRAVKRANLAIEETGGVLKGILWHQGESDSQSLACAQSYQANLQRLVQALRTNIVPDSRGDAFRGPSAPIPFVAGTMSRGVDARGDFSVFSATKGLVDSAHRTIGTYLDSAGFVNNDDLVPPAYPCGAQSCIHFGSVALREMGNRYYQELKRISNQ